MTCYHPIRAYQEAPGAPPVFKRTSSDGLPLDLPCGQCIGCRLERSRQWAIRCVHEASLYEDNSFVTLTYADEHLPPNSSLHFPHFQSFMKRLRRRFDRKIRFFHCGEYGEYSGRPHYHALLFNLDFPDKIAHKKTDNGMLYRSPVLEDLWGYGHCLIGNLTFESAAYVARYCVKKRTGKGAKQYYSRQKVDLSTGEPIGEPYQIAPEYATMSRRPGIGAGWLKKYGKEVFDWDQVVVRGKRMRPPKAYDRYLEKLDPALHEEIKFNRHQAALKHHEDQSSERLVVREEIQHAKADQLRRRY